MSGRRKTSSWSCAPTRAASTSRRCSPPIRTAAPIRTKVWTEQLNSHRDYLAYSDLLFTIIETNVSAERLAEFKRGYFEEIDLLSKRFHENLGIEPDRAGQLFNSVLFHAVSINGWCTENPLVAEAMEIAGLEQRVPDFKEEMRDFIEMCLAHYCR